MSSAGIHLLDGLCLAFLRGRAAGQRERDAADNNSPFHRSAPLPERRPCRSVCEPGVLRLLFEVAGGVRRWY
jgi:hypothetical protein